MTTGIERRRFWNLPAEAAALGPYDEQPLIPAKIDPQVYASRNDREQPFYLICEHDTMLAFLAGAGRVAFHDSDVARFRVGPGDFIYVPARTPHRVEPDPELLQLRYKAAEAGLEAVAWYCAECGGEVWRSEFDTAEVLSQQAWWDAAQEFNASDELRTCACGTVHPPVDLTGIRWPEVAEAIRNAVEVGPPGGAPDGNGH